MRFRVTRSGNSFSPWDVAEQIASSIGGFELGTMLRNAFITEEDDEGEGTEHDGTDGTSGFREVVDKPGHAPLHPRPPTPDLAATDPTPCQPLLHVDAEALPNSRACKPNTDHASESEADSSPEYAPGAPASNKRKRKSASTIEYKKQQSKKRRALKRLEAKGLENPIAQPGIHQRHVISSMPIAVDSFSLGDKTPAATAYVGMRDAKPNKRVHRLSDVVGEKSKFGFNYVEWDGRTACPITDKEGRVIVSLCGHPDDPSWGLVHREAARIMSNAEKKIRRTKGNSKHRRGRFVALAAGVSFGGGQKVPGNMVNTRENTALLDGILASVAFIRLAGFANSCFATWAPKLFAYYLAHINLLFGWYGRLLRRNFSTVFACSTFNFGPATVSFPHTDPGNLPFGLCAITALGPFNPKLGGHLILWDLKLVIEFPPGSTVLIPSAVLRHSNTSIQKKESRYSFTQYTAGGLFRWVDHGFQKEAEYHAGLSEQEEIMEEKIKQQRWSMGLGLFSTVDELKLRI